jgi:hypothetical protein
MLEAKICEAGPGDKRPNPISLSEALKRLSATSAIKVLPKHGPTDTPFYVTGFVDITTPDFQNLIAMRRHLYLLHKGLTERNEFCSDVLEGLIDSALERSGVAQFISRFPHQNLPQSRPLDFVVDIAGVRWGGEAKNFREWLYPESQEIWAMISKCCELDVVPLLITRKIPYVSFLFFAKAGVVGYQTHFQYFHPTVEPELARVIAVDGLGYKDIHCTLEPDEHLINLFQRTLPKIGVDFRSRFSKNKDALRHFADSKLLADRNLNPNVRKKVFAEAWKVIVGGELSADIHV